MPISNSLRLTLLAAMAMLGAIALPTPSAHAKVIIPELPKRTAPDLVKARKEAQRNYAQAAAALEAGNGKEAKLYAKIAYATLPNASTAGLLCIALREVGENEDAFYSCLVGLSLSPSSDEKKLIDATVAELGKSVNMGWANVQLSPKTAKVSVDGKSFIGSRVVGLSPGDHALTVSADGHTPNSVVLTISAGVQIPALVSLSRIAVPLPIPSKVDVETEPSWMTDAGWGFIGVGGALVLGGVGFQIAGAVDPPDTDEEGEAQFNVPTYILASLGGVMLISGVLMVVLDPGDEREVKVDTAQIRYVSPAVSSTSATLVLGGSF